MSETGEFARAGVQCRCVVIHQAGTPNEVRDRCGEKAASPDQPFCTHCETQHQNPEMRRRHELMGATVTVVPL